MHPPVVRWLQQRVGVAAYRDGEHSATKLVAIGAKVRTPACQPETKRHTRPHPALSLPHAAPHRVVIALRHVLLPAPCPIMSSVEGWLLARTIRVAPGFPGACP